MAVTKLGEFKSRFPYSKYAAEAELLIANANFDNSHYAEAVSAYNQFVKLHPKHPEIEFARFRVGESYWKDAPDSIDQEQEYTQKAISEWEKLIADYPKGQYTATAKELMSTGKERIAASDLFVAKFYCKLEIWHACAHRATKIVDTYNEFRNIQITGAKLAAKSLKELALLKAKDPNSDKNLYFKSMSAAQLESRAADIEKKLADFERSKK